MENNNKTIVIVIVTFAALALLLILMFFGKQFVGLAIEDGVGDNFAINMVGLQTLELENSLGAIFPFKIVLDDVDFNEDVDGALFSFNVVADEQLFDLVPTNNNPSKNFIIKEFPGYIEVVGFLDPGTTFSDLENYFSIELGDFYLQISGDGSSGDYIIELSDSKIFLFTFPNNHLTPDFNNPATLTLNCLNDGQCAEGEICNAGYCEELTEICEDRVDNDNDGYIDCLDDDCANYDNQFSGFSCCIKDANCPLFCDTSEYGGTYQCVDCLINDDCPSYNVCLNGECSFMECIEDADCTNQLYCVTDEFRCAEGWCHDSNDNDYDGLTDCQDPDCIGRTSPAGLDCCIEKDDCIEGMCSNNQCVECATDGDCAAGETCQAGSCVFSGCAMDSDCSPPDTCVFGTCWDTQGCVAQTDNSDFCNCIYQKLKAGINLAQAEGDCSPFLTTERCDDGFDNDYDQLADCADSDCIGDPICDVPLGCATNEDCDPGFFCDIMMGECMPEISGCTTNIDCGLNQVCITYPTENVCELMYDANRDGMVTINDFSHFKTAYLSLIIEDPFYLIHDTNEDNEITINDFSGWKNAYLDPTR
jgi:Cys-rich repeat protein